MRRPSGALFVSAAMMGLVACAFEAAEKLPPPAEGGETTNIGPTGESSPSCAYGVNTPAPLPDLGTIDLVGDGVRVRLNSAPSDPAYNAAYPIEGLTSMRVRIEASTRLVPECVGKAGPTECPDHPFFTRNRGSAVEVFDVFGKVVFKAEVPTPPRKTCVMPEAGAIGAAGGSCKVREAIRSDFCNAVNAEVKKVATNFEVDCAKLEDPTPPIQQPPKPITRACMPMVSPASGKASSALEDCDLGASWVSTWVSAARAQLLTGGVCSGSPLVLDLDGSGLSFGTPDDGVAFDLFGTGQKVRTAWPARSNVAFLALDANADGSIEASELFGSATAGGSFSDGFEALRALDGNGDLVLDRRDPAFHELVLWVDRNHDGTSTRDELSSLETHGIESLALGAHVIARPSSLDTNGNDIPLLSHYRMKSGRTGAFADVFFRFKP